MTSQFVQENTLMKLDELKELAAQSRPCISIYLPDDGAGNSRQLRAQRIKTALKQVTGQIAATEETEKLLLAYDRTYPDHALPAELKGLEVGVTRYLHGMRMTYRRGPIRSGGRPRCSSFPTRSLRAVH